jgi:hypothetical protein
MCLFRKSVEDTPVGTDETGCMKKGNSVEKD